MATPGRRRRTDQWPKNCEKMVDRTINQPDSVVFGSSKMLSYSAGSFFSSNEQIVITYSANYHVFAVWNAAIHYHNKSTKLTCGAEATRLLEQGINSSEIKSVYKGIEYRKKHGYYEKVLLVGKDALLDFCRNYREYLLPNVSEIPNDGKALFPLANDPDNFFEANNCESLQCLERERIKASRARRDSTFRDRVLKRSNGRCIVCGTTEEKILQAAHIFSVATGGSDDTLNGICLCANHHLMYDSGIIDIDLDRGIFTCDGTSEAVKKMAWYNEAKKRHFQLFLPSSTEKR